MSPISSFSWPQRVCTHAHEFMHAHMHILTPSMAERQHGNRAKASKTSRQSQTPKACTHVQTHGIWEVVSDCLVLFSSSSFFFSNPFYYQTSKDVWNLKFSVPVLYSLFSAYAALRKAISGRFTSSQSHTNTEWIYYSFHSEYFYLIWPDSTPAHGWIQWHSLLWKELRPTIGVTKIKKIIAYTFFSLCLLVFYITYNLVFFC